ncbi:MAG: ABC transporter ATP-binding protein [Desulfobulbaceae bacterium]|uniref:ABC transporter ATP-binding protein n=1 Tax=Candidatus Desulfobia pelagia TaxID=2841692 RepID=A0A8J6NGP0_9BACT|nr:ABC transporter ATP-binding protein [Candidatus Desulfobia pelagia]
MADQVIEFDNVSFAYGAVPVLSNVSFSIERNHSVCIVGPNGGGKSTLIKLILGLLEPDEGKVTILGGDPDDGRSQIGYMPQYIRYDQSFPVSVMDVALMGRIGKSAKIFYSQKDKNATMAALEGMGVADLANRPFNDLSGGQRQRVLIARAMACDPELLLLDEPTANVDPAVESQLHHILKELTERITVITVSHDLGFVSRLVDRVICVNRYVRIHPTSDITGEVIQDIYGGDIKMVRHDHCCSEEGHSHDRIF